MLSLPKILEQMQEHDRYYVETSLYARTNKMQTVSCTIMRFYKKYPEREFTTMQFTAVGADVGEIRYLIEITRLLDRNR